jgi:hypothetical protein
MLAHELTMILPGETLKRGSAGDAPVPRDSRWAHRDDAGERGNSLRALPKTTSDRQTPMP